VSPLGILLHPEPNVYPQSFDFSPHSRNVNHAVSYSCGLFVAAKNVNSFAIKQIRTLLQKHPGWGYL
jgi:hypothetical protein